MKEIAKTGYWNGETAHLHHVHSQELSNWICEFLKDHKTKNLFDFGCGLGNYLKDLQYAGFQYLTGFEADPAVQKVFNNIVKQDLTIPFNLKPNKGNVISLEVGEHIPAEYMNIYLDNICNNCNNYLITSWAIRGQAGFGHVNCLDNHEIIPLIESRDFKLMEKETEEIRNINLSEAPWFKNTLLIFKKNDIK
jgi:SAM-dependent methyltransferase